MARIPRFLVLETPAIYHLSSRTTLEGFPIIDEYKDKLLNIIFNICKFYYVDILGFCVMGNHFHFIVRMNNNNIKSSDKEIMDRYLSRYGEKFSKNQEQTEVLRSRIGNIGFLIKDIKQIFTRYFNNRTNKRGFFWGERFKSVIIEEGFPFINSLAYIDLNPVRAGLVEKPEEYKWNTIGYIMNNGSEKNMIRYDLWMNEWKNLSQNETVNMYREFIYETGAMSIDLKNISDSDIRKRKKIKDDPIVRASRFIRRCRYFTDSGILGSHDYVKKNFDIFKHNLQSKDTRLFTPVIGLNGVYSMKRLGTIDPPSHYGMNNHNQ